MPLAWTNLLAILNGIAAQGHSRTVAITLDSLKFAQALLDLGDDLWFREELVWAALYIPL
jgi:hypothetical protein